MKCHQVDYQIVGDDMQMVLVELDPQETVIAEAGAMNFMEDDIQFETRMGDGSQADQGLMGKLFVLVLGRYCETRARPVSMTYLIPGIVREVSATLVATTIFGPCTE